VIVTERIAWCGKLGDEPATDGVVTEDHDCAHASSRRSLDAHTHPSTRVTNARGCDALGRRVYEEVAKRGGIKATVKATRGEPISALEQATARSCGPGSRRRHNVRRRPVSPDREGELEATRMLARLSKRKDSASRLRSSRPRAAPDRGRAWHVREAVAHGAPTRTRPARVSAMCSATAAISSVPQSRASSSGLRPG